MRSAGTSEMCSAIKMEASALAALSVSEAASFVISTRTPVTKGTVQSGEVGAVPMCTQFEDCRVPAIKSDSFLASLSAAYVRISNRCCGNLLRLSLSDWSITRVRSVIFSRSNAMIWPDSCDVLTTPSSSPASAIARTGVETFARRSLYPSFVGHSVNSAEYSPAAARNTIVVAEYSKYSQKSKEESHDTIGRLLLHRAFTRGGADLARA